MLSVRGVGTHIQYGGVGEPVLFLHPEFAAGVWAPFHDRLAARFRLYAPDHPGFGRTERPDWVNGIDDLVFHYVDLLDMLDLERVHLVGSSLGGWIAAALAVAHPDRIARMVLAAPAGIKVEGAARYDIFANTIDETLPRLFHDQSRAAQIVPVESGHAVLLRVFHEATTLARLAWDPYLYDPKLQQRLSRVSAPTLVVWGEKDAILSVEHACAFADLISGAALKTIPLCGHLIPYEQPEAFAKLTISFLVGEG